MPSGVYTKSETHKKNLSESLMGHKVTDATKAKIQKSLTGKIISIETRKKISKANTGKVVSQSAVDKVTGTNNGMWKELVGYTQAHRWARKHYSKSGICEECKQVKKTELANISQQYLKELSDWRELCRSCHIQFDRNNRLVGLVRRV